MNIKRMIRQFGVKIYVNKITTPGSYIEGIWKEPIRAIENIKAVVQPLNGKEIQSLSEGNRKRERIKVWSLTPFTIDAENPLASSDHIHYNNKRYKVLISKDYVSQGVGPTLRYFRSEAELIHEEGAK